MGASDKGKTVNQICEITNASRASLYRK
ncbi:helix-turn-helix domain-containing protein [Viridibacillus soli]